MTDVFLPVRAALGEVIEAVMTNSEINNFGESFMVHPDGPNKLERAKNLIDQLDDANLQPLVKRLVAKLRNAIENDPSKNELLQTLKNSFETNLPVKISDDGSMSPINPSGMDFLNLLSTGPNRKHMVKNTPPISMSSFYHVRISRKGEPWDVCKLDLSEEELRTRVLVPYENETPFTLAGTTISFDKFEQIKITRTSEDSSKLLHQVREEAGKSGIATMIPEEYDIIDRGIDVTDDFIKGPPGYKKAKIPTSSSVISRTPIQTITSLCDHFHVVVKQLQHRHENRKTLSITDEYDVQDLMHALLRLSFEDVRPEEVTPSYAGTSSRMDFLLKAEATVIEVKYNLRNKELRDQLAVDIETYRIHPDCKTLACFVYDPNSKIENPIGLERDFAGRPNGVMKVIVLVRPLP